MTLDICFHARNYLITGMKIIACLAAPLAAGEPLADVFYESLVWEATVWEATIAFNYRFRSWIIGHWLGRLLCGRLQ